MSLRSKSIVETNAPHNAQTLIPTLIPEMGALAHTWALEVASEHKLCLHMTARSQV